MSRYYVLRATDSGETLELAGVAFTVGREARCDIRIDNPRVSRCHARLAIAHGQLSVEDLRSANGTQVNGQPIRTVHRLDSGDVLTIGGVSFLVIAPEATTGMTVVSSHLPERATSFVEDQADSDDTLISRPYALPAGWRSGPSSQDAVDRRSLEKQLSKALIRRRVATEMLTGVLFAINGPQPGCIYPLQAGRGGWLLGRGSDCQVRIDDVTVSRHHALLQRARRGWKIRDLETTNGCTVNDQRVAGASVLRRGDILSIGSVALLFRPLS